LNSEVWAQNETPITAYNYTYFILLS